LMLHAISLHLTALGLLPGLALYGVGIGFALAQLTNVVLSEIPNNKSGVASGTNTTSRQVGSALGIAVIGSVVFASAFFVIATYAEIIGLAHAGKPLDQQTFPLGTLVNAYGIGELKLPITVGALFSAFSVCLACITTAGRIAYAMAMAGLLPRAFAGIEPRHDTPNVAVTVVTAITLVVAVGALASRVAPIDVFNNCGTLSTFGFILIYMLIAVAALVYTKQLGEMRVVDVAISGIALILLVLSTVWFFATIPGAPQHWFVYYFLAFILAGALWFRFRRASG